MTDVDKALRLAESRDYTMVRYHPADPFQILAAEVRRLRAGVEKLADKDQTFQIAYGNDRWVKVDDVLAALEGRDG